MHETVRQSPYQKTNGGGAFQTGGPRRRLEGVSRSGLTVFSGLVEATAGPMRHLDGRSAVPASAALVADIREIECGSIVSSCLRHCSTTIFASLKPSKMSLFQSSSGGLPLKRSQYPFSHGEPGSM